MTRVVLYELNEVPWQIVDLYIDERPTSVLAGLLARSRCLTTRNDDPVALQPWRTWPTFHKSLYVDDHRSFDLGQDPDTFVGENMWDVADHAGLRVGLFGPLQSWPPRRFNAGGFFVPDTFSPDPATEPPALRRFQAFNLAMTRRNGFSSDASFDRTEMLTAGIDLVARGLTPWSACRLGAHVAREKVDNRYKACRPMMQVLPCFDLYRRLDRRYEPHLSVFFTNHVAAMMHRYWGDGVPGYAGDHEYEVDPVFRGFTVRAMDLFDHQLGRLVGDVDRSPGSVLIVASSMGQGPIEYREIGETYVLEDAEHLVRALGLGGATVGLAMYPSTSLRFSSSATAKRAAEAVRTVTSAAGPMFGETRAMGTTVSFEIAYQVGGGPLPTSVRWSAVGSEQVTEAGIDDLGIAVRRRLGGGNTAYHVADGMMLAYGDVVQPDESRRQVSVLDAAPSILRLLDLEAAPSMRGAATLFQA